MRDCAANVAGHAGIATAGIEACRIEGRLSVPGMETKEAQHAQPILRDAGIGIADETHARFGEIATTVKRIVERAVAGLGQGWSMRRRRLSPRYTTHVDELLSAKA